jgi:hypothetical protein
MKRFPGHLLAPALAVLLTVAYLSPAARAQSSGQGQWQTLPNLMPINPVHTALLHNGKVLIVSGSGNVAGNTNFQAGIFDPATGTVTTQPVAWDMFCNGMVVLADGRAIVNGGTLQYDPFHGQLRSAVYDPATGQYTDMQTMAHGLVSHGDQFEQWYDHDVFRPGRKGKHEFHSGDLYGWFGLEHSVRFSLYSAAVSTHASASQRQGFLFWLDDKLALF